MRHIGAKILLLPFLMLPYQTYGQDLQRKVDSLVALKQATIGVAVKYGDRLICRVNADKAFPMMSVFKLHQAIAVIDSVGHEGLASKVHITKGMLQPGTYSPLRDKYPDGDICLSIEELLHYTLWLSDNNACDILFDRFGGTALTACKAASLGLKQTQIRWTETEMHSDTRRCQDNSTTPEDAISALEAAYTDKWLRHCLLGCSTGTRRIPAMLPPGTAAGHKTGTGDAAPDGRLQGINDIGFVMLPDGTHFFIAILCNDSKMTMSDTEHAIAEIARLTYDCLTQSD